MSRKAPARACILARLVAVCSTLLTTGCVFPSVSLITEPRQVVILPGSSGIVTIRNLNPPFCDPARPLPCVDVTGRVYEYVVQNLPPEVTYRIDSSLQSPGTPGVARITFDVSPHAAPGEHYVALIQAVVSGRALGTVRLPLRIPPAGGTVPTAEPIAVAASASFSIAALADGSVRAWGLNDIAQLGTGDLTSHRRPTPTVGLHTIVAVSAETDHALALSANGLVWGWGDNRRGQLGTGDTTAPFVGEPVPVQVRDLHDVQAIAAGHAHSLALRSDGTVWAWGDNAGGKLGTGGARNSLVPGQVQGVPQASAIAAGDNFSLAAAADGSVWIWGAVVPGHSSAGFSGRPVQVPGLSGIVAIAARGSAVLAVDRNGRVWAWGWDFSEDLDGDSTWAVRATPVPLDGVEDAVAVAIGFHHALALTAAGTVWAWGGNTVGQLGSEGVSVSRPQPARVPGLTGVRAIAAGGNHSLALLECGQLWAWGYNEDGQIGDGTDRERPSPLPIAGLGGDAGCETVSLRVTLAGAAGPARGVVTSSPDELRQDADDLVAYLPRGSVMELTAIPEVSFSADAQLAFDRWTVDCGGAETRTSVVLDRSKLCAAEFRETSFDAALLTVLSGGGLVTSSGGTILGSDSIECGTVCNAIYRRGASVSLTAANTNGFGFTGWARDCSGTASVTSVNMDGARTCEATFRPFELAVNVTGAGAVVSDGGAECAGACTFAPRTGTVTLTARPAEGWQVQAWGGDCTGQAARAVVTMDADRSCTATFARTPGFFFLTMIVEGQGTVTSLPPAIACPPSCVRLLPAGTALQLTAHPASSWTVLNWGDDCSAAAGVTTSTVVMSADRTCRVRFTGQPPFAVAEFTYTPGARVGRLVTFDGNASYVYDPLSGTRDLSAVRSFAWDFNGDGTFEASGSRGTAAVARYAFQAAGAHAVRLRVAGGVFDDVANNVQMVEVQPAEAPLVAFTVAKTGTGEGVVLSEPPGLIECGARCTSVGPLQLESGSTVVLSAHADARSTFLGWSGASCAAATARIEVTVTAAVACTATFMADRFTLTVNNGGNGEVGSVPAGITCGGDCSEAYAAGTALTLTATPSMGFAVGAWTGCDAASGHLCTLVLDANRTVSVAFVPVLAFTLNIVVDAPPGSFSHVRAVQPPGSSVSCRESGGPVCSATFAPGTVVVLRPDATSLELRTFLGWNGCDSVATGGTCTVTMTTDRFIGASFSR